MDIDSSNSQAKAFTSLSEVRTRLDEFFRWPDRKILMIKGPWGSGKSYFLRDYIAQGIPSTTRSSILPQWTSYASLFGCTSIEQVEERVAACALPTKFWNGSVKGSVFATALALIDRVRFSFLGASFNLPATSLVWHFTKTRELLIVLDDLERTGDGLKLKEVFGFASSLAENSKAGVKILLVCNADKLGEEAADTLSRLREKVIHTELFFNPSPEELVDCFFLHRDQSPTMLACLRAIGEGNIRIIRRVSSALTELVELFRSNQIALSDEDKAEIVRLCVFYYRAERPITRDWFTSHWSDLFDGEGGTGKKKVTDPTHEVFVKLGASGDDLGPLVVEWLSFGTVDSTLLKSTIEKLRARQWRDSYHQRSAESYAAFNSNFAEGETSKVIGPVTKLLDDFAEELSLEGLFQHFQFLSKFSISPEPWLLKHVRAKIPMMDIGLCHDYLRALPDGEAKELIRQHRQALNTTFHPRDIIWKVVTQSSWSPSDMEFLAGLSVEDYQSWLESESDPKTLQMLREFVGYYQDNGTDTKDEACRRVMDAVERMAETNKAHQVRATVFSLIHPKRAARRAQEVNQDGQSAEKLGDKSTVK